MIIFKNTSTAFLTYFGHLILYPRQGTKSARLTFRLDFTREGILCMMTRQNWIARYHNYDYIRI